MNRIQMVVVFLALALAGTVLRGAEADIPAEARMDLRLQGALAYGEDRVWEATTLHLSAVREEGRWQRFVAWGPNYNSTTHLGVFRSFEADSETLQLDVAVDVQSDAWVKGGRGRYRVTLERQPDGEYRGTYRGDFKGIELEGTAEAGFTALREPAEGFRPVAPGEHPRLLFRAADLPALKAKANTPFGKACMSRMEDSAVGLGMLYQLTGKSAYADRARAAVEAHMADNENGNKAIRCRFVGWRLEQFAMAYDLCYHAWPGDFRKKVVEYMLQVMYRMNYARGQWTEYIAWSPWSETTSAICYAGGLAGLAMYGDPGPGPQPPPRPFGGRDPGQTVEALDGLDVATDDPVSPLVEDELPSEWLYVGPFTGDASRDHLAPLGGWSKARPSAGDAVSRNDNEVVVRRLTREKKGGLVRNKYTGNHLSISATDAGGKTMESMNYFYTVVRNDKVRWVRFRAGNDGATAVLNGAPVVDGDVLRLGKGSFPLMVRLYHGRINPWGQIFLRPHFEFLTDVQAERAMASIRANYEDDMAMYEAVKAQCDSLGGADARVLDAFDVARTWMYRFFNEAVTRNGFLAGSTMEMAMEGPDIYATCYRNVFGMNPTPYDDISRYIPRKLMAMEFIDLSRSGFKPDEKDWQEEAHGVDQARARAERGIRTFDLVGHNAFLVDGYQDKRDAAASVICSLFPVVDEPYRGVTKWFLDRHQGVPGPEDASKILDTPQRLMADRELGVAGTTYHTHPVYAFVNYPLDVEAVPPGEAMPLTWQCPDWGYHVLRNAWTGDDQFIVQVCAQTRPAQGSGGPMAGVLAVQGLGYRWMAPAGVDMRGLGQRAWHSVVVMPNANLNDDAAGVLTYAKMDPETGSGSFSINLDTVYAGTKVREYKTKKVKGTDQVLKIPRYYSLYQKGGIMNEYALEDRGLSGMRAIAVDYTGESGAPCLLAIVDTVRDTNDEKLPKKWLWQLGSFRKHLGDARRDGIEVPDPDEPYTFEVEASSQVAIDGNTFTIVKPDATLRCTFVEPADVRITVQSFAKNFRETHDNVARKGRLAVVAEAPGQPEVTEFFAVMTIQPNAVAPPPVKVVDRDAGQVAVGEQRLSFDGEKILVGVR